MMPLSEIRKYSRNETHDLVEATEIPLGYLDSVDSAKLALACGFPLISTYLLKFFHRVARNGLCGKPTSVNAITQSTIS